MMQILLSIPTLQKCKRTESLPEFHEDILKRLKSDESKPRLPVTMYMNPKPHISTSCLIDRFSVILFGRVFTTASNKTELCLLTNFWLFHYVSYLPYPSSEVQDHPPTLVPTGYLSTAPFPHNMVNSATCFLTQRPPNRTPTLRLVIPQALVPQSRTLRPLFPIKAVIHIPQQRAIPHSIVSQRLFLKRSVSNP